MSDPGFWFQKVSIDQMPGFPPPRSFEVGGLSPALNVVYGPNASGKTTLAKALQGLTWSGVEDDSTPRLRGRAVLDDDDIAVTLDGTRSIWERNGSTMSPPELGSSTTRDRYYLALHDLLYETDTDRDLAKAILRESAGGYDVAAAMEDLGLRAGPYQANISEVQTVHQARQQLQDIRQEVIDPSDKHRELQRLVRERDEAKQAKQESELLSLAIDYFEAQRSVDEAEQKVERFPAVLDDVTGDEIERLQELEDNLEGERDRLREAEEKRESSERKLEEANLPDDIDRTLPEKLRNRVDTLRDHEHDIQQHEQELQSRKETRSNIGDRLGESIEPDEMRSIDAETIHALERLAERTEEIRAHTTVKTAIEDWLGDGEQIGDEEELVDGIRQLEKWLQSPEALSKGADSRTFLSGLTASSLVMLAGLTLGLVVHPLGYLLIGIGAALSGLLFWLRTQEGDEASDRAVYRRDFEELELDGPKEWTASQVTSRLTDLRKKRADVLVEEERRRRKEEMSPAIADLEDRRESLVADREAIFDQIGIDVDLGDRGLNWLVQQIADWQDTDDRVRELEAKIDEAKSQREEIRETITSKLEDLGYDPGSTADELSTDIEDLARRIQDRQQAEQALETATEARDDAKERIEDLERQIEDLYEALDLEPGERTPLEKVVNQLPDYEQVLEQQTLARSRRDDAAEALCEHPRYESTVLDRSLEEVRAERQETESLAEQHEELVERVTEVREEIRNAKQESQVEDALTEYNDALASLADRQGDDYRRTIGRVIGEYVHEQTRDQDRPEVFHKAQGLFEEITRGRYQLRFADGDPPKFRAYDSETESAQSLAELSEGTRLQLLLAVRLGFIEHHESGPNLPIFLDETIANTDDIRAPALMDSVLEIASGGRQVFYFTAQRDEVEKWRHQVSNWDGDGLEAEFIDLTEVRVLPSPQAEIDVSFQRPGDTGLPDPENLTHQELGQAIDVPDWNPRQPLGSLHMWYLIEDTDTLHGLLKKGIRTWGQFRTIGSQESSAPLGLDDQIHRKTQTLARVGDAFREAWKIGRGRPVTRSALEETSAVTSTFIDDVSELARRLDGDAERILEALEGGEVDRFRRNKIDELREYLRREGYLDKDTPLDDDQIWARVVDAAGEDFYEGRVSAEEIERFLNRITGAPSGKE